MESRLTEKPLNKKSRIQLPVIGWREWVRLPDLGVKRIKAKVDTGARSSSLHASDIQQYDVNGETFVRFKIHSRQRDPQSKLIAAEAKVIDMRSVKSSSGETTTRPVIVTDIELLGQTWSVELTLANRDEMGFRMLLGREAFRGKFLVDAGKSFYGGKRKKKKVAKPVKSHSNDGTSIHQQVKNDVLTNQPEKRR